MNAEMQAWIAGRPECVQKLFAEFPPGTKISVSGEVHYVVGYKEDDTLIISPVNPYHDYDGAQQNKVYLCAQHLRNARS